MKVVGRAVAYDIVPFDKFDDTVDSQEMVDFATVLDEIEEEPRNGSFLPH